ncbi:MAG: hypothetical protein IJR18_05240, partial [Campylobacter sp.]|nr:hypothetical protein [Campylobacter sp.]
MKKLLFLLPFLLFEFAFCYGETYLEYKLQDVNKTDSKIAVKENFQYCFYELKENIPKTSMYIFNQGTGFYITAFGTYPNLTPNFGTIIYENLETFEAPCGNDSSRNCSFNNVNLYNPVLNCSRFNSDGSCASGLRVCVTCDISKNEFPNPDTNSCITCPVGETFNYATKQCEPICKNGEYYDTSTKKCFKNCEKIDDFTNRMDCFCNYFNKGNFT